MNFQTMQQVPANHLVIRQKVYDVTTYLNEHPGGPEILKEVINTDATEAFEAIGHSTDAQQQLEKLYVGELLEKQRVDDDLTSTDFGISTGMLFFALVTAVFVGLYYCFG